MLARQLQAAGHETRIVSWLRQYPQRLYPGQQHVDQAEFAPFDRVERSLSWDRPDSWLRAARGLRHEDLVVFAHTTPIQVPPYWLMARQLAAYRPRTVIVCHNVLPHERRRVDPFLVQRFFDACDGVVTHSAAEADAARLLTDRPVSTLTLAPHLPDDFLPQTPSAGLHRRLLFFGLIRPYKGVDLALRALAQGPADVQFRVAGEFWHDYDQIVDLVRELGLSDRVEIRPGYVPSGEVPKLFADVDGLVLPYRSATGSQQVWAAFQFGVPVIVTRVGQLSDDVREGVNGLVAEPGSVESLAEAFRAFYAPGVALGMREQVQPVDPAPYWKTYVDGLIAAGRGEGSEATLTDGEASMQQAAPPGGRMMRVAKVAAEQVLWGRVRIQSTWVARRHAIRPLPAPVVPTDVLRTVAEYQRSIGECRGLGLPLHPDAAKNWDALGAVSVILNELGTATRVLDAGAARYSPILPWLSLYGVEGLVGNNLEFTRTIRHGRARFEPGDITRLAHGEGSFDAVTCMSVIEHGVPLEGFVTEMQRVLRPGGLLVISTDYNQEPVDTTGKYVYGAPVKIFDPDGIRQLVSLADSHDFDLVGPLRLEHEERPVFWKRTGLRFTFIRLTFRRR
ncbi:MAG: glycosyltransferase [Acidimicrobiaceae bacterium]|nr:glycosyltransferase [Acidimicrobiaceae bacterium]